MSNFIFWQLIQRKILLIGFMYVVNSGYMKLVMFLQHMFKKIFIFNQFYCRNQNMYNCKIRIHHRLPLEQLLLLHRR
ncbi:unnamed protein product [Schistosoma curassoni]|uniref:Secreted protein n=1 Tax=Schistosoma curassoni TaxID=6186 RepID=A0A183L0A4_9TREM|nr:unnamed protein product [Schistosoma curassoni]